MLQIENGLRSCTFSHGRVCPTDVDKIPSTIMLEATGSSMQHWYVYHSTETMGHPYRSLGESAVFSKNEVPKLLLGDSIWVIEGPKDFTLVDCFIYTETDDPPFRADYGGFKLKLAGDRSLLASELPLDKGNAWFKDLHSRFITKQRFFDRLTDEHVEGLQVVSGVSF